MPPPRTSNKLSGSLSAQTRFGSSCGQNSLLHRHEISTSSNTSNSRSSSDFKARGSSKSGTGLGSNLSSNSDAHKPRRKRRHRKKKKQVPHLQYFLVYLLVSFSSLHIHCLGCLGEIIPFKVN